MYVLCKAYMVLFTYWYYWILLYGCNIKYSNE